MVGLMLERAIEDSDLSVVLSLARGIAFDNCHKIYVLMDEAQMEQMREYGYDPLMSADEMGADEMLVKVNEWFEKSCSLRFVEAVSTVKGEPSFRPIVEQGSYEWYGYEEEEDE